MLTLCTVLPMVVAIRRLRASALCAATLAAATQAQAVQCGLPVPQVPASQQSTAGDDDVRQRLQQRFSLAASGCSASLLQPAPAHEAQQLRLYDAAAQPPATPAHAPLSAPGAAPGAVAANATRAAPGPAAPARVAHRGAPRPGSTATVQRIRALVPTVADAARRHDIDPLLLHAVAHVESRHNAQATSHAGARGVMQVMPATGRRFGVADPLRQLHDPDINVHVGAEYLKVLQQRFGNNLPLVLAAYNAGEGSVEKYGRRVPPYPETQAYVREVMSTYQRLRQMVRGEVAGTAGRPAP